MHGRQLREGEEGFEALAIKKCAVFQSWKRMMWRREMGRRERDREREHAGTETGHQSVQKFEAEEAAHCHQI